MQLTGKLSAVQIVPETGTATVTFEINEKADLMRQYLQLKDIELLTIDVEPYRPKRSIDANAYAWKLIVEIADVLRASKEEIYFQMLKKYGQSEIVNVYPHIPVEKFFKYYEKEGSSTINGETYINYRVYKGSSEYNTREMAVLLDGIVSDAKELNIPTEPPEELEKIKSLWKEKKND